MCRIVWYYIYTYYIWASVEMGIIHSQNGWYFLEAWIVLQVSHLLKYQKEELWRYQRAHILWCALENEQKVLEEQFEPTGQLLLSNEPWACFRSCKCLLNKPCWRSNVEKNLFCTLYRVLKLVKLHSYMNYKCQIFIQNAELLTPVTQNWHNFFRSYEEMAKNRRKQQKSMSLSLTSETAVEYTIWPANDTYIITVCWVMKIIKE